MTETQQVVSFDSKGDCALSMLVVAGTNPFSHTTWRLVTEPSLYTRMPP